jgi:hypothetical protein
MITYSNFDLDIKLDKKNTSEYVEKLSDYELKYVPLQANNYEPNKNSEISLGVTSKFINEEDKGFFNTELVDCNYKESEKLYVLKPTTYLVPLNYPKIFIETKGNVYHKQEWGKEFSDYGKEPKTVARVYFALINDGVVASKPYGLKLTSLKTKLINSKDPNMLTFAKLNDLLNAKLDLGSNNVSLIYIGLKLLAKPFLFSNKDNQSRWGTNYAIDDADIIKTPEDLLPKILAIKKSIVEEIKDPFRINKPVSSNESEVFYEKMKEVAIDVDIVPQNFDDTIPF